MRKMVCNPKRFISVLLAVVMLFSIVPIDTFEVNAASSYGYIWPVEGQIFGRGFTSDHKAIDIVAPTGTTVKAAKGGTVICASTASTSASATCGNCGFQGAGYHVLINHSDNTKAMYAHLNSVEVYTGATVSIGQKIGTVGSTGNSTGAHLHFALFLGSASTSNLVDPLIYLTPFSNVYVSDVTETSAIIHGDFGAYGPTMTAAGIYIGTDPNNMKKITETLNTDGYDGNGNAIQSIFYGTSKWYGTLKTGTTYYYRVWISRYGLEYVSDLKSFTPGGSHTHSWSEWQVIKKATCYSNGTQERTCSCGASETATIEKVEHDYFETYIGIPTCTEPGVTTYTCAYGCGNTKSEERVALGHSFTNYTSDNNATATTDGTKTAICDRDGCNEKDTVTEEGSKLTPISIVISKEPTKAIYAVGDTLDTTGMQLTVLYSNGTSKTVYGGWILSATVLNTVGTQNVTVTYSGKTTTLTVTVIGLPFVDVAQDQWYYDTIKEAYELNLMYGVNDTQFKPNTPMSRAMMATVLYRMAGSPNVKFVPKFPDVAKTDWYAFTVTWAADQKVINGYNSGRFAPNDNVTREQVATMLCNYAKSEGKYKAAINTSLDKFNDGNKVSSYAVESMQWAVANGLLSGKDNGVRLDPQGTATRAECTKMLLQAYKLLNQ